MKFRKTLAIYSIIVGLAVLGIWIVQLLTGQATELETAPIEIALAIPADWLTAIMLLVAGAGLLSQRSWADRLYLFALGMLVYSVVISTGYFGQLGNTYSWLCLPYFLSSMCSSSSPISFRRAMFNAGGVYMASAEYPGRAAYKFT